MASYEETRIYASGYESEDKKESYIYITIVNEKGELEEIRKERSELEKIIYDLIEEKKKRRPTTTSEIARQGLDYIKKDSKTIEDYISSTNEDVTQEVDYLGPNILGMYDPVNDKVYVLKGLDPYLKEWVKAHEYAHRRRAYTGESQDERLVDAEASATVGYNALPGRN